MLSVSRDTSAIRAGAKPEPWHVFLMVLCLILIIHPQVEDG